MEKGLQSKLGGGHLSRSKTVGGVLTHKVTTSLIIFKNINSNFLHKLFLQQFQLFNCLMFQIKTFILGI